MKKLLSLFFILLFAISSYGIEVINNSGNVNGTAITPTSVTATGNITSSAGTVSGVTVSGKHTGDGSLLTGTPAGSIALTGDVTGSGTSPVATTIANGAVSLAKMADMATASLIYRKTAAAGPPEVNTLATLKTDLGLSTSGTTPLKGDGAGGITNAVPGTDYLEPTGSGVSLTDVAPLAHKTTEDAIVGLVQVDGAGNYTAKVIGTHVQAQDTDLQGIADLSATTGYLYQDGAGNKAWCSGTSLLVGFLESGTTKTITAAREYYVCTAITTVTAATPTAGGWELCVQNGNNVSSVINITMPSGVMIENQARTSYSTAGTGHGIRSSGAAKDQICIVSLDPTHYHIWSATGTWTVY